MSYKALYRVYRPNTFDEIQGQEHIQVTLMNIIKSNKIGHAYLFSGPRGTGKTSVAKIFAKAINCPARINGVNPCEQCNSCTSANENKSLDIIEMDAASNNGISEIREIRDRIKFSPTFSPFKVYIIDEIHMLSKGAFNALLKTLEEPPTHAIFILATTEPEKIPMTILSRVQRFNFVRISLDVIEHQLKFVLDKEKIDYEKEAIKTIADLASGSLRDALSIADQAAAYTNGKITNIDLFRIFGVISIKQKIILLNLLAEENLKEALKKSTQFIEDGANIEKFVESLVDILKDFIVYEKTQQKDLLSLLSIAQINDIVISIDKAYYFLDLLVELLNTLQRTEVPIQNLMLAILKMSSQKKAELTNLNKENYSEEYSPILTKTFTDNTQEFTTQELSTIKERQHMKSDTNNLNLNIQKVNTEEKLKPGVKAPKVIIQKTENLEVSKLSEKEQIDEIIADFSLEPSAKPNFDLDDRDDEIIKVKPNVKDKDKEKPTELKTPSKLSHSTLEIINLLLHYDPASKEDVKERHNYLPNYLVEDSIKSFVELFMTPSLHVISVGKQFILFVSEKQDTIDRIQIAKAKPNFANFIKKVYGLDYYIFVLPARQWTEIANEYRRLNKANALPKPEPIITKNLKIRTDEEEYGTKLFGDLFKTT